MTVTIGRMTVTYENDMTMTDIRLGQSRSHTEGLLTGTLLVTAAWLHSLLVTGIGFSS